MNDLYKKYSETMEKAAGTLWPDTVAGIPLEDFRATFLPMSAVSKLCKSHSMIFQDDVSLYRWESDNVRSRRRAARFCQCDKWIYASVDSLLHSWVACMVVTFISDARDSSQLGAMKCRSYIEQPQLLSWEPDVS